MMARIGLVFSICLIVFARSAMAETVPAISLDWATYNPVSLLIKKNKWVEEAFPNTKIEWQQSVGSDAALRMLDQGRVDFGSTAGIAALLGHIKGSKIHAIYSYSRPEWTAIVVNKDSTVQSVKDLKGKVVASAKGTDPYIFLIRALTQAGLDPMNDVKHANLPHANGRQALLDKKAIEAWAGLDPLMAEAELNDGARLIYRNPAFCSWGVLNVREMFAKDHPETVKKIVQIYERGKDYAQNHPNEIAALLADEAKVSLAVAKRQLERTDFKQPPLDPSLMSSVLEGGKVLQSGGVIEKSVQLEEEVKKLFDNQFVKDLGGAKAKHGK